MTSPALEERYEGRPLLRLLDDYVLDIAGALPAATSTVLLKVVRLAYPNTAGDTWQEVLENELELGPDLKHKIHAMWLDYQQWSAAQGQTADPSEFAMSFVDENFAPLIDKL